MPLTKVIPYRNCEPANDADGLSTSVDSYPTISRWFNEPYNCGYTLDTRSFRNIVNVYTASIKSLSTWVLADLFCDKVHTGTARGVDRVSACEKTLEYWIISLRNTDSDFSFVATTHWDNHYFGDLISNWCLHCSTECVHNPPPWPS